jgi:hypothetical protein
MKTIRSLLAASALLIPLAGIALTSPAAQAAPTSAHAAGVAPNVPADCAHTTTATRWSVNATGISIKNAPNGTNEYSIAKTATFNSDTADGGLFVTCYDYAGGQYWVYGQDQAHTNENGWVGCHYLDLLGSTLTCPEVLATASS